MNYISKTISKQAAIVSLSAFILVTAIAGLIMDASGVPWLSIAQEYDSDTGYDDFESQDWEECCEDDYEQAVDTDAYDGAYDTQILLVSPLTGYLVLILIFSALCLTCALIPFDIRYKVPTVTLFGLATTITGIFLARKSAISFSIYLSQLANSGDYGSGVHLHVMIYFGALVSMICLLLGSTIIVSVKDLLFQGTQVSRTVLSRAQLFLSMSLVMFLLSPLVPIAYISYDEDYEWYDEDEGDGEYLFPSEMLRWDDWISSSDDGYDDDELDAASSTFGNYAIVEDLFFALMWINLSVIMLMSMSMIPMVGKVFSSLGQLNILSAPLVVIALIFSIILYVNIPDLLGEDTWYSDSRHDSIYFHVNWLPLICCIVAAINWVILLIKCHIPWWKEMGKSSQNLFENFNRSSSPASYGNQNMMQGRMAPQQQFNQQQYNQQMPNQQQFNQQQYNQQMYNQQQQRQFGRQPPRF